MDIVFVQSQLETAERKVEHLTQVGSELRNSCVTLDLLFLVRNVLAVFVH